MCTLSKYIIEFSKLINFLDLQENEPCLYNFTTTEAGKSLLFKEWELIVDEEDEVNLIIFNSCY